MVLTQKNQEPAQPSGELNEVPASMYRLVVEGSTGFGVLTLDPKGKILTANVGLYRLCGYKPEEILGRNFAMLFRQEDQARGMPSIELTRAEQGEVASDDNWIVRRDGTMFWAAGATSALRNEKGELLGFAKMVRDASDRKRIEEALLASEQQFRQTISQIKDYAIFSTDDRGIIATWNEGCKQVLGYERDEFVGLQASALFTPEDVDAGVPGKELADARENGAASNDRWMRRRGGERFWASGITTRLLDENGRLIGFSKVLRDLTERHRSAQAMQQTLARVTIISEMARNLLSSDDPAHLLQLVYDSLAEAFSLDFYFHFDVEPDARRVNLSSFRGVDDELASPIRSLAFGEGVCGAVAETNETMNIGDVQKSDEPRVAYLRKLGVDAYICAPLITNGTIFGTLSFGSRTVSHFGQDFVELVRSLSDLISVAFARHRANVALRSREEELRLILEASAHGFVMLNSSGNIVLANARTEQLFGYQRSDLAGQPFGILVPERLREIHAYGLRKALDSPRASFPLEEREFTGLRSDGSEFPLEVWMTAANTPEGVFVVVALVDITARKNAERALRESERRFRFLYEMGEQTRTLRDPLEVMSVVTRLLGSHLGASRCAYADVAPNMEDLVIRDDYNRGVPSAVGEYKLSAFGTATAGQLRGGSTLVIRNVNTEVAPSDGRESFNAIQTQAIVCCPLIKEGKLQAVMAVHQNEPRNWTDHEVKLVETVVERCWSSIERARIEQALLKKQERLDLALEAGRLGMWEMNTTSRVVNIDARVAGFFGLPPSSAQVPASFFFERIHPEDRAAVSSALEAVANGQGHYDTEFRVVLPDGRIRWLAGRGDLMPARHGSPAQVVGLNFDITARKESGEELRKAQLALQRHAENLEVIVAERTARLRETVAELERFSYSLSHDMRAPLRAMQGFAQVLAEDYGSVLDEIALGYLQRIANASGRLDQLIRDVLSYTMVVREKIVLLPIEIEPLVRQLIIENPELQPPNATVTIRGPLLKVMAHEAYLTQCLSNLLANAVKFTAPNTHPRVTLWTEAIEGDVRLYIEDNGIGIPNESLSRIFEMFERMHPPTKYEGTGIGLAIVRKAIERMGGQVGVKSRVGEGTVFWLQLKQAAPGDEPHAAE